MVFPSAVGGSATAFVDVGTGASVVEQLESRRTAASEGAGSVFADAEAETSPSVVVESLALVDVHAGAAAVERFFVAVVAGALIGAPGVDAFVLAAVIRLVTFVDVATIAAVARRLEARVAIARVGTFFLRSRMKEGEFFFCFFFSTS